MVDDGRPDILRAWRVDGIHSHSNLVSHGRARVEVASVQQHKMFCPLHAVSNKCSSFVNRKSWKFASAEGW